MAKCFFQFMLQINIMPVFPNCSLEALDQDGFQRLDYEVMRIAFSVQNELGPYFCDEKIYQAEIAYQCEQHGLGEIETELPIRVEHGKFVKTYFADMLINRSAIYELKSVRSLNPSHQNQLLNYMFLLGLHHGKLINMYPESVEHKFVSTRLTTARRHEYAPDDRRWDSEGEKATWLKTKLMELLADWGVFLDVAHYTDAIDFFRNAADNPWSQVKIHRDGRVVGQQHERLLSPTESFRITTIGKNLSQYKKHLQRFLRHTFLSKLHWINMNHHSVQLVTLWQQEIRPTSEAITG